MNDIHRVLKPGGFFGTIWNVLDERTTSWVSDFDTIIQKEYNKSNIPHPWSTDEWLPQLLQSHGGFGPMNGNDVCYRCSRLQSLEFIMKMFSSMSCIAAAEPSVREQMLGKLYEIVKRVKPDVPEKNLYKICNVIKMQWFQKV